MEITPKNGNSVALDSLEVHTIYTLACMPPLLVTQVFGIGRQGLQFRNSCDMRQNIVGNGLTMTECLSIMEAKIRLNSTQIVAVNRKIIIFVKK
jgi:hypothetical protein